MREIDRKFIKNLIPERKPETHKGDYGKVLIAAGSKNMTGACILAVRSALRAGSGLVYACTPEEISDIIQIAVPEVVIRPYCVSGQLEDFLSYDAVAVGPGLSDSEEARCLLYSIVDLAECPVVIDADGLNMLAGDSGLDKLRRRASTGRVTVITPHMGEAFRMLKPRLKRLEKDKLDKCGVFDNEAILRPDTFRLSENGCGTGTRIGDDLKEAFDRLSRVDILKMLHEETGASVVLKGNSTLVYEASSGETFVNTTGNSGMATAGSGDVLTGIITSLLGQNISHAVAAGVYIHGLAGDKAAEKLTKYSLVAGDISDNISAAFKEILEEGNGL